MKNIDNLIGRTVTAIGDCGTKKNMPVKGTLITDRGQYLVKLEDRTYTVSVHPKSINPILEYHREPTSYEIGFGNGATHYKDFEAAEHLKKRRQH